MSDGFRVYGSGTPGAGTVTNAMLASMPARTVKANPTNAVGQPQDVAGAGANTIFSDTGTALAFQTRTALELAVTNATGNTFLGTQVVNKNAAATPGVVLPTTLHLVQADGLTNNIQMDAFGAFPFFAPRRANGTGAAPTQVLSGDNLFFFQPYGRDNAGTYLSGAAFGFQAMENYVAGATGTRINLSASVNGATGGTKFSIQGGFYSNLATGGDKGLDTINVVSYYANNNLVVDNNALLRARPFTVGTLPATPNAIARVTDATVTLTAGIGTAPTGGGANDVPVNSNAASVWRIG